MLIFVNEVFHSGSPTTLFSLPSEAHSVPFLLRASTITHGSLCQKVRNLLTLPHRFVSFYSKKYFPVKYLFYFHFYSTRKCVLAFLNIDNLYNKILFYCNLKQNGTVSKQYGTVFYYFGVFDHKIRTRITPSIS